MSYLFQPDYVTYTCTCGAMKPIVYLYFCRHCLELRCGFCISHEIDSHFCANCLENLPSSEARLKKNRCSSCFDCPSCFHTLSTRATMSSAGRQSMGDGDGKVQPKKMYYLSCFNCRWTSRDVGIPDQPVASGGWPERPNPNLQKFNAALEYYKALVQQEKNERLEKDRKRNPMRGKYLTLTDKIGVTGAMARNVAGLDSGNSMSSLVANFTLAEPVDQVEELSEDVFTKDLDINEITTLEQRYAAPEFMPETVDKLYPIPKQLSIKRSQRCRACDHNLTKPEYNPGSIKFKIELLAYYHVPEVKIITVERLRAGGRACVTLKLTNPTAYEMSLRLLSAREADEQPLQPRAPAPETRPVDESLVPARPAALPCDEEPPRANVTLLAPADVTLTLSQRDDAAEYDEDNLPAEPHPQMIVWRKSNKMAVKVFADVTSEAVQGEEGLMCMVVEYTYKNTVPPTGLHQPRQPQEHLLRARLYLKLGPIAASEGPMDDNEGPAAGSEEPVAAS